ncbi:MAG: Asp-tRNA(Asn)/Glu-tRNA(Gln) amidotransferase subunit GatA [Blastocatellia bacterium]|nr:Asp-tRNA(Asn)/Glu-tRNA(Gln) amidotransferase subunit GatA [Blastocatellia bacterium]
MDITGLTVDALHAAYAARETTATEVCTAVLDRIEAENPQLNAFITVTRESALAQAARVDEALAAGESLKPLAGVPVALKDNQCLKGVLTTCASKILGNFVPPYTATAVAKLAEAGAIFVGKANMDEFAMGSSTENSSFGPARNPWNQDCVPGGSSGGSAAAVAADLCVLATGSDTGGSIRQPASLCGVVGLKPTYGRVSRYGLVAFGSSLDQIGPFGKTTRDVARMLGVLAGHDVHDATSAQVPVPDYLAALDGNVKGLRIGVPKEAMGEGLDPQVKAAVEQALRNYAELGAEIVETTLPNSGYAIPDYYIIATAEASANLARFDGVRFGFRVEGAKTLHEMYQKTRDLGFGTEVKRRIMLGTYTLSSGYYDAYYLKAQKVRTLLRRDFERAFESCDVLLTPTAPTPAFKLGEKTDDPLQMYLSDIYTVTLNMAGVPGLSVPCGLSTEGLPIGMQLIAPHFAESRLLNTAFAYEQAHPFPKRKLS